MNIRKQWLPVTVSLLVAFFVIISMYNLKYRTKEIVGNVIATEVLQLQKIFERIDADCTILGFDNQKNPINFLNVISFVGSEVGPMNLTYPDRWKGPYLPDNPVVKNKEYQIVRTQKGYFITPGEGVTLPNGKVVGKDIILDENADILKMMFDEQALYFEDTSLAAQLKLGQRQRLIVMNPENTEE